MIMGSLLLLISLLCVSIGTWRLIGIYKSGRADSKPFWWGVAGGGITLFFLLKMVTDTFPG